jgi:hypothetical protein
MRPKIRNWQNEIKLVGTIGRHWLFLLQAMAYKSFFLAAAGCQTNLYQAVRSFCFTINLSILNSDASRGWAEWA